MTDIIRTPLQVGTLIRRYRKKHNLSQTELATRLGLRQATISEIETGNPAMRFDILLSILAALKLEIQIGARTQSTHHDIEDMF